MRHQIAHTGYITRALPAPALALGRGILAAIPSPGNTDFCVHPWGDVR
jgi:hypothetical protein